MKRLLYENGNKKVFRLTENEYIYIVGKQEYFFDTKYTIKDIYVNSKKEIIAESSRHVWNLDKFSYLDKQTNFLKYNGEYDLSEYKNLHPFLEYTALCKEVLYKRLEQCEPNRDTPSKTWLRKQYDFNLWILQNPAKLNTIIHYIIDGDTMNNNIVLNQLNWLDNSYIKKLDDIFGLSPKLDKDIIVYRGVSVTPEKFDITQFDKRFVSTSLLEEPALKFIGGGEILMVIKLKKGIDSLLCFSFPTVFSHETELLLPRKVKFKIISKSITENILHRKMQKHHVYFCEAEM